MRSPFFQARFSGFGEFADATEEVDDEEDGARSARDLLPDDFMAALRSVGFGLPSTPCLFEPLLTPAGTGKEGEGLCGETGEAGLLCCAGVTC